MTKKIFVQPELMVVNIRKNDILTTSTTTVTIYGEYSEGFTDLAPERYNIW